MSRRKKVNKKDITEGFRRLAFGDITDAVSLLFESDEKILRTLPRLDLFNVSEIKKPRNEAMEIKFFDRFKALEKLNELVGTDDNSSSLTFYEALEKSAKNAKSIYENDYDYGDEYE